LEKISNFTGVGVPFRYSNVDTDQIIPAIYLKRISKTGYEDGLFSTLRQDPEFVLNQKEYQNPQVLVAGSDFGTGSSREHAVWALRDFGFKAVFSPKFADIFRSNCGKQGLIAGVISSSDTVNLWEAMEADPGIELDVDLPTQTVRCGELKIDFEIDEYTKWRLSEGLDDIGITLQNEDKIADFEARRASWRPKTLPVKGA
jgi:3-isopropylmalate/(R)-2-methylmalate dehydratase small subunit